MESRDKKKGLCVFLFDALEGVFGISSKFSILKSELCPLSFLLSSYAISLFYSKANASERVMVNGCWLGRTPSVWFSCSGKIIAVRIIILPLKYHFVLLKSHLLN
jgi:hypothetical protein